MAAKHIAIATSKGVEQGFEALLAYLDTPVGQKNPNVQEFVDKIEGLTFDDALQVYCEHYFGDKPEAEPETPATRVISIRKAPARTARAPKATTANSTTTTRTRPTRKARKATAPVGSCISAGDAWIALGGQADFEPKDHDKPANNGQLYRLNSTGLLVLNA